MRKLIVTCQCGQRMQVPRSAVGKTGLCPTCGQIVTISNDNATATTAPKGNRPLHARQVWWEGRNNPPEDAKRKFGEAVDLYYGGRYGEALAIFDALAKQFPGNQDIENGRTQCTAALRRAPAALEDQTGGQAARPKEQVPGAFDEETVRRVILDKMLYGSTEAVQLQAAELAARLLGMFAPNGRKPEQAPAEENTAEPDEVEDKVDPEEPAAPEEPEEVRDETPEPEPVVQEEQILRRSRIPIPSESDLEQDRKRAMGL